MENIGVSHQLIMNSLLNNQLGLHIRNSKERQLFVNGKALKGNYLNCVILSSPYHTYPGLIFEINDIIQNLRMAYYEQLDSSIKTVQVADMDVATSSSGETLMTASMDHSERAEQEIAGASGKDSTITILEGIKERMLDMMQQFFVENSTMSSHTFSMLIFRQLFFDGLKYLGTVLKDTQITHLNLAWNEIECDMLIAIMQNLRVSKFTRLNLNHNRVGHKGKQYLERVLRDPDPQISSLDVCCDAIAIKSPRTVVQSGTSTTTNSLDLSNGKTFGNGSMEDLVKFLRESPITSLNLTANYWMTYRHADLFTSNLALTSLTCLNLSYNRFYDDTISKLGNVLKDTQITEINLCNTGTNDSSLQAFVKCLANSRLTHLNLARNELKYKDMKLLARVIKDSQITWLDIGENRMGCQNLQVFLPCLVDSKIASLDLRYNELGELKYKPHDCIKYLASILKNTRIRHLNLEGNYIQCNRLEQIILCLPYSKIESLNLGENIICCNTFYLASLLKDTQITSLHLCKNQYAPVSLSKYILKLLSSESETETTELDLKNIGICTISLYYVSNLLRNKNITHLILSGNNIDSNGLKYLCRGLLGSQVVSLNLRENYVDSVGVEYLARVLKQTRITSLNLACNEISCSGWKYLLEVLEGSQITTLDLSFNCIGDEGIEFPAINLERTKIVQLNLSCNKLSRKAVYQLCESVERCRRDSIVVEIGFKDEFLCESTVIAYPDCFIEKDEMAVVKRVDDLLKNKYDKVGITKIIACGRIGQFLQGACDNIDVSEIDVSFLDLNEEMISIFDKSNIAEIRVHGGGNDMQSLNRLSNVTFIALLIQNIDKHDLTGIETCFMKKNIMYLDLSDNCLYDNRYNNNFSTLVNALKDSQLISLNLSKNKLNPKNIELLAKVLPHTKLHYIDLSRNNIGYSGFKCIMDVVSETDICWLSLADNNIDTELLPEGIELSSYIVPRNDTPIAFQMRYLFLELVSLNSSSNEFEFIIPPKNSEFALQINHYPWFVKNVLEIPNSHVHFYDLFYMKNKRHNIHVLKKFNHFVKEIKQSFRKFIENSFVQLEAAFGYESFVDLVKESEALGLNDFVEFLLLHRVLYYVDDEQNFLHPFIYKMLHKYGMPLFSEGLETNKKEQIISYFLQHSEINGAQELIDLLCSEPYKKKPKLH